MPTVLRCASKMSTSVSRDVRPKRLAKSSQRSASSCLRTASPLPSGPTKNDAPHLLDSSFWDSRKNIPITTARMAMPLAMVVPRTEPTVMTDPYSYMQRPRNMNTSRKLRSMPNSQMADTP